MCLRRTEQGARILSVDGAVVSTKDELLPQLAASKAKDDGSGRHTVELAVSFSDGRGVEEAAAEEPPAAGAAPAVPSTPSPLAGELPFTPARLFSCISLDIGTHSSS